MIVLTFSDLITKSMLYKFTKEFFQCKNLYPITFLLVHVFLKTWVKFSGELGGRKSLSTRCGV